jgi:preprotein translocase subunit Sss1
MGLPRIVVARMLVNAAIDLVVGAIPFAGDAFDMWFKANTRNLSLMRQWLDEPERSTRNEWVALLLIAAILVGMVTFIIWLIAAIISALLGAT